MMQGKDALYALFLRLGREKRRKKNPSLPTEKVVHGITVKKLPIGQYLKANEDLADLFCTLLAKTFPTQTLQEVYETFFLDPSDGKAVQSALEKCIVHMPQAFLTWVCNLLNADWHDVVETLTPFELSEVLWALWEVNDYTAFFLNVRRLSNTLRTKAPSLLGNG